MVRNVCTRGTIAWYVTSAHPSRAVAQKSVLMTTDYPRRLWVQQIDDDPVSGIRRAVYQATIMQRDRRYIRASGVHAFE